MLQYANLSFIFLQHSKTFEVLLVFLPLTIAELLTLKQVRFFWPTLYIQHLIHRIWTPYGWWWWWWLAIFTTRLLPTVTFINCYAEHTEIIAAVNKRADIIIPSANGRLSVYLSVCSDASVYLCVPLLLCVWRSVTVCGDGGQTGFTVDLIR